MNLTPAQQSIVASLCTGATLQEHAFLVSRSPRTMEIHLRNARRNNGARTTYHLCAMYMKELWLKGYITGAIGG